MSNELLMQVNDLITQIDGYCRAVSGEVDDSWEEWQRLAIGIMQNAVEQTGSFFANIPIPTTSMVALEVWRNDAINCFASIGYAAEMLMNAFEITNRYPLKTNLQKLHDFTYQLRDVLWDYVEQQRKNGLAD